MKAHLVLAVFTTSMLAMAPLALRAQEPQHLLPGRIMGTVVDDETLAPIVDAQIRLLDSVLPAVVTDGSGRFSFPNVRRGVYEIELGHIGYGSGTQLVNVPEGETVHLEVRLRASAIELDSLMITVDAVPSRLAAAGVLDRQRAGFGHFFLGDDAVPWKIVQNLLSIPRIEVTGAPVRTVLIRTLRGGICIPEIYLDGILQRWAEGDIAQATAGLELDAIEVYRGISTPPQFVSNLAGEPCGAIVLWRKQS